MSDDAPQYSFSLFTEDWPGDVSAAETAAEALMQTLAVDALTILRDRR